MLAPLLGLGAQSGPSWAGMGLLDPTADVLAMFQGPLPPLPTASNGSGSSGDSANRRAQAAAAAMPLPPLPAFVLPPLPDASSLLGSLPLPALDPAAAAAFAIHPAAAAAAATFAAAATMADTQQQQQAEESMADAASCPAAMQAAAAALAAATAAGGAPPAALAGPAAATPVDQAKVVASALTSHLSDMAGPDAEMHGGCLRASPRLVGQVLLCSCECSSQLADHLPSSSTFLPGHAPPCRHCHLASAPHGHCPAGWPARPGGSCGSHPDGRCASSGAQGPAAPAQRVRLAGSPMLCSTCRIHGAEIPAKCHNCGCLLTFLCLLAFINPVALPPAGACAAGHSRWTCPLQTRTAATARSRNAGGQGGADATRNHPSAGHWLVRRSSPPKNAAPAHAPPAPRLLCLPSFQTRSHKPCLPLLPPLCSKRPRRAASGGVLGAVAAEASEWGLEMVSPPLKRANSLPVRPVDCAWGSLGELALWRLCRAALS